jgi:hemolysin III
VAEGSDRFILNEYPITHEEQYPSSAFPFYALAAFWAFFTPLLVGLQVLMPRLPIVLAGYAAITWSMILYEILHAIDHWPYEWWKAATEHPRFGKFWSMLYGFHLMHHANVGCNEGIGSFFGFPIADWCLGTYHRPKELLLEGRKATAKDFAIRPPRRFVRWLDRWARKRETGILHDSG